MFEIIPPAVDTSLGNADGYDKSNDDLMNVDAFVDEVVKVIEVDTFETGIGIAEQLHQQRDALFGKINQ